MENIRDNAVEVRKNVFILKNDPDFLRKYLNYFPNDAQKLYEYALQLELKGKRDKAKVYLSKAAENGSYLAKKRLLSFSAPKTLPVNSQKKKKERKNGFFPFLLFLFLLLFFLLAVSVFFNVKHYYSEKTIHHHYNEEHIYHEKTTTYKEASSPDDLPSLVVNNAAVRYKEMTKEPIDDVSKLFSDYPKNYLSSSPSFKNPSPLINPFDTLELVFYSLDNKLALVSKNKVLVAYNVASGDYNILPPSLSKVEKRIVNPNGGQGAFGTRGLVLGDNFAIHGTDDPSSIGKRVSMGCIRMNNKDIENLYPYVSLGTPFKIVSTPLKEEPMYKNFLPPLVYDTKGETTPGAIYNWKH